MGTAEFALQKARSKHRGLRTTTNLVVLLPASASRVINSPGKVRLNNFIATTTQDVVCEIWQEASQVNRSYIPADTSWTFSLAMAGTIQLVVRNRTDRDCTVQVSMDWEVA